MCKKAKGPNRKLQYWIWTEQNTRNEDESNRNSQGEDEPKHIQQQAKIPNENARKVN